MSGALFEFTVRKRLDEPFEAVRESVSAALGCEFREDKFRGMRVHVTEILGMYVGLFGWQGRDRQPIARMDTDTKDKRLFMRPDGSVVDVDFIDLSAGIITLLEARGAGLWYVPTREDTAAEQAYGYEVERRYTLTEDDVRRLEAGE